MITIAIPLLVAVIGLLIWVLASNGKVQEMGKILFFWGVGWTLYAVTNRSAHLF